MAKWYRAGSSRGSPPIVGVGDTVEAQVYDDEGNEQGTVLLGVLKSVGDHHGGRLVEAAFLGASDTYYHWWMNQEEGSPSKSRGVYHLCALPAKDCPPVKKLTNVVHTDRYRCLGAGPLTSKQVPWLKDRTIYEGYLLARGGFDGMRDHSRAEAPAKKPHVTPDVDWEGDENLSSGNGTSDPDRSASEESAEDISMKNRIKQLRHQLKQAEDEAAERRASKDKKKIRARKSKGSQPKRKRADKPKEREPEKDRDRGRSSKPPKPVDDKDVTGEKKKRRKRRRRASSEKSSAKDGKKSKKKRKAQDSDEGQTHASDSSPSKEELFKAKKDAEPKQKDGDQDRGPFGGGPPISFGDDSDDSTASEGVFRKGLSTSAKSSQQKLLAYTNKYPGRLASRMLLKMEHATARGVEGPSRLKRTKTPAVALNHIITILLPNLGVKAGVRSTRELKTLGTILDLLAQGFPSKAADVVTQRIKAVERASHESHWGSAQFLELLAPENSMLLDKDEEIFVSKEYLLEQRLRQYDRSGNRPEGGGKGKAKGAKGKTKDKNKGDPGAWEKSDKGGRKPDTK